MSLFPRRRRLDKNIAELMDAGIAGISFPCKKTRRWCECTKEKKREREAQRAASDLEVDDRVACLCSRVRELREPLAPQVEMVCHSYFGIPSVVW